MDQLVTNEMLALLICWAVGIIMGKLEQQTQLAKQERLPRQGDTSKDSETALQPILQPTSVLDRLANAQAVRNEDSALIEAFRIVAQERMKGTRNGKQ